MQRDGVMGVLLQDMLIELFRFTEATSRVMLHREVDGLLHRQFLLVWRHIFGVIQRQEGV